MCYAKTMGMVALMILGSDQAGAQATFPGQGFHEIETGRTIVVGMSNELETTHTSADPEFLFLGTTDNIAFCALSSDDNYRHGQAQGQLSCAVELRANRWTLVARGHVGSGAAASIGCQAICMLYQ
ncbi:hypothetical protein [Jannaschia sp. CCS1]|uniref:hypothetical protein n=1 Tax=Jannaschia sp. (strain CCS1) TaxID=290400 RepID=UPI000053A172|nr:hypothetical protein [Jannaschia sp. CCS1]ABD54457.1 hypothetical protein Jann_1540 [Jannaschia sp. CCS1]